jgi:uncharacterized protein YbcC (UPF0753/DUF2309 family)
MNKKEYLALMHEYENIIEDKHFNPHFYNKHRLEELIKQINHQLSYHEKKCLIEMQSQQRKGLFGSNAFELGLIEAKHMYAPLMQRIKDGESIQSFEYEKCYMELRIGPFKVKHILILYIIGYLALIVRWYLSYFGFL